MTHFEFSVLFALLVSAVFGIVSKRTNRQRFEYAVYCFLWFMASLFAIGWLMYLAHR